VTNRLTFNDAVDIWLRHWAGEYQNTIAARYDVSQGRVNASGRRPAAEQRDELAPFHSITSSAQRGRPAGASWRHSVEALSPRASVALYKASFTGRA
jgi:hypothetical protein